MSKQREPRIWIIKKDKVEVAENYFECVQIAEGEYVGNDKVKVIEHSAYQRLIEANKKLENIISKELSENDEFGAEFVIKHILQQDIEDRKEAYDKLDDVNIKLNEKIRELEKANADCISLFLHEERMKAQAAELKLLKDLDSQRQAIVMSAGVKIENLQAERDIYLKALEKIHSNGHTQACIYANEDDDIYVCDCHIDAVDTAFAIIEGKKTKVTITEVVDD